MIIILYKKINSDNSENDRKYITIEDFNNLKDIIVTKNDFENLFYIH